MDARIERTEKRMNRLTEWLAWTRYPEAVRFAVAVAGESLARWRALRATLVKTWTLVKERSSRP